MGFVRFDVKTLRGVHVFSDLSSLLSSLFL